MNTTTITHVIVTRPAHQSKPLCEGIAALNIQSILLPSLVIDPTEPDASTLQHLAKLHQADLIIVTSTNVASFLAPYWPPGGIQGKLIAVGPSTRLALEAMGIRVDSMPERFTSEGILAMPECLSVTDKYLLILSGKGGRNLLINTFAERGANAHKLSLYQRLCPPPLTEAQLSPLLTHQVLVIFTSFDSLSFWWNMFPEAHRSWLLAQQTLVISDRLQEQVVELGFSKPPWMADNATDQAILACIQSHLPIEEAS